MKQTPTLAVMCCLFLAACANSENATESDMNPTKLSDAKKGAITGEVFYRERKLLPPGSNLIVTLEDVSKMDAPSTVIESITRPINGSPPYKFAISYNKGEIQPRSSYSLRAKITFNERLLMTSTQALDPFRAGQNDIQIMLQSVAKSEASPVKAETGLAIVSVNPLSELTNTYWKLIKIGGKPVSMGEKQAREAYFQLKNDDNTVKGFTACNQFMGSYTSSGNRLSFENLAMSRKACIEGMDTESAFMEVLNECAFFSIHEHSMTLLNAAKKPIARFEARYFN